MEENKLKSLPVWELGFRPFFLFGSVIGIALMLIWLFFQNGISVNFNYYDPITWHAHEMIFGFALAIIIGFLLTSSQNWSGKEGIKGTKLKVLFFLWLAARVVPFISNLKLLNALVDLSFLILSSTFLLFYLSDKKQLKNQGYLFFLSLMFIGNLMVHLQMVGLVENIARKGLLLGIASIILIITLISGRIFPFFTNKSVENAKVKSYKAIDYLALLSIFLLIIGEQFFENTKFVSIVSLIAGLIHFFRWISWNPWQTRKVPILWILYLGYFWIIVGFILKGLSGFIGLMPSLGIHAWTVGGISILIYAMISRVSLGHTGRPIKASKLIVSGYIILNISAITRVFMPLYMPEWYVQAIFYSACFWIFAFILFIFQYWKILISPRVDGKPG